MKFSGTDKAKVGTFPLRDHVEEGDSVCGLWASVGLPRLQQALSLVAHRGPDGSGWQSWSSARGELHLGHRRLSIQDRSDMGAQPLAGFGGRQWIIFNGEVLNFPQLRAALAAEGAQFRTDCDTEVLLTLIRKWGLPGLRQVRGFFAFVMLDLDTRRLVAARDRYGIKPLYYASGSGERTLPWLAFASEIKQFTAIPGLICRLDAQSLRDRLNWGLFDHTQQTFFEGISQLAPGHALSVDLTLVSAMTPSIAPSVTRWTDEVSDRAATSGDPAICAQALRAALDEAVALSLRADVETSVALSGGLDSSSISALAARQASAQGRRVKAFGVMFEDDGCAESVHAEAVARRCGLDFESTTITPIEMQRRFESVLWHFDEPVLPPNMLAQHAVFELAAARGLRVVLTGQGGDELLCGYPSMYGVAWREILSESGPLTAIRELVAWRPAGAHVPTAARGLLSSMVPRAALQAASRGFTPRARGWERRFAGWIDTLVARSCLTPGLPIPHHNRLARLCHALMRQGNLRMLLHFEDRNSMAFGIESRPVMVDAPLERLCLGLPASMKLRGGRSKWLLRQAMRGTLPDTVLQRSDKLGFPFPDRLWQQGPFHGWLCEQALLAVHEFGHVLDDLIDLRHIEPRLRRGVSQGAPLWALAGLGAWTQRFNVRAP